MSRPASEVPLTVFDTSPIVAGSSAREALHNTVDLAQLAENLGYYRYWVAEHHGMRGVASCATAVVIARVAAATRTIRVGSGAVLLPNHAPLVLAEEFGTLEAFHPGRIDLGLGRALGGSKRAAALVRSETERAAKPFNEQLVQLMSYFDSDDEDAVRAVPAVENKPSVWLLGSTDHSATLAASLGLPYAYGNHINPAGRASAIKRYRDNFTPSKENLRPRVLVSVPVIAAETDADAEWLAGPIRLKTLRRSHGKSILLPKPAEAACYPYTRDDRSKIDRKFADHVVGSSETVLRKLQAIVDDTGADELAIQTAVYDHADRCRSYRLIAEDQHRLRSADAAANVLQ